MKKILISIFLSTSLFGQQIFLECENLYLGESNTKWINNKCVRVEPKVYDYLSIDESRGTYEIYKWQTNFLGIGETFKRNSEGNWQFCGARYLFGQEFIDYKIRELSKDISRVWEGDLYYTNKGIARFNAEKIELNIYKPDEGGSEGTIDRISGIYEFFGAEHQCEPISRKKFNSAVAKMKADSSKLQKAQNKYIEEYIEENKKF